MRKRPMAALIAGAVLALVAGCGGGGDGGDKVASISSPPAAGAGDGQQADNVSDEDKRRNFAKCMREHGINMPEPKRDANGQDTITFEAGDTPPDEKKMKAADEACRKLLPNGGEIKPPTPEELDKMRKEAKCMRDHGIDFPDPEPAGKGGAAIALGDASGDPKKFEEAAKACGLGMTMRAAPAK
ncbi:hypothetical protein [Amycolatopsis regifaucium]|uniref:Secreted protein n=1 Tax=Amycolatopsis regifaucium TaxID=546365 RepID=A0A154MSR6_9PSEU|nr:hypothetical protein [Amycolatopsis regifaucium]KZB87285.1 hypothetical protein AVL48_21755 [Amycolatopsis regifaucium]OKA08119.1 hypothetical protein ATP06_0212515 [Amycolatopsis regifaucium]SFI40246.1 hypothetical protein SAMN04489731_110166 [Amycolatopsis regifaucium]